MRTNIEIDDKLLHRAMKASKMVTKKAAVEAALRMTVDLKRQEGIRKLFGKIQWDGDLDAMRQSRVLEGEEESAGAKRERSRSIGDTRQETATAQ